MVNGQISKTIVIWSKFNDAQLIGLAFDVFTIDHSPLTIAHSPLTLHKLILHFAKVLTW